MTWGWSLRHCRIFPSSYDYMLPTYGYDYTIPEPLMLPMTFDLPNLPEPVPMEFF